ncbi:MAG: hypothetical protein AAF682_31810 [Planctomycetota bacterium]
MPAHDARSASPTTARRFLALLAGAVVALELVFGFALPVDRGRHEVDRLARETALGAPAGDVVLLADSVCYAVLDPDRARDAGLVDLASNQSVGVAGNVFLLERLREARPEPLRAVVYIASPRSLREGLHNYAHLGPYFTSVFLRDREIADVEARLDRSDLVEAMRAERSSARRRIPSNQRAGWVLHPMSRWLRSAKQRLERSRGNTLPPLTRSAQELLAELSALDSFDPPVETVRYLERLAEVTAEAGAVLVLCPPPLAPTLRAAWGKSGLAAEYEAWMGAFAGRHDHVLFEPSSRYLPSDDRLFTDGVHLTPSGKREWEQILFGWLSSDGLDRR